jgi:hypothetical protein
VPLAVPVAQEVHLLCPPPTESPTPTHYSRAAAAAAAAAAGWRPAHKFSEVGALVYFYVNTLLENTFENFCHELVSTPRRALARKPEEGHLPRRAVSDLDEIHGRWCCCPGIARACCCGAAAQPLVVSRWGVMGVLRRGVPRLLPRLVHVRILETVKISGLEIFIY